MELAEVSPRWQRAVEDDIEAWRATQSELFAVGIDPTDPFSAALAADDAYEAEQRPGIAPVHDRPGTDPEPGFPGWLAAHVPFLREAPGDLPDDVPWDLPGDLPSGPSNDAASLASRIPEPALVAQLDALTPADLTAGQLADVVAAWERVLAWAHARQAAAIAELSRRPQMRAGEDGHARASGALHPVPLTAAELCVAWPWTRPQAERTVAWSTDLTERFPRVLAALREGRLDERRARVLVETLADHPEPVVTAVLAAVMPYVHSWTSVKLSRVIRRLLLEAAPETARQRRREERARRRVWMEPAQDGMAWLYAYLPAEDAAALMNALSAAAGVVRRADSETPGANAPSAGTPGTGTSNAGAPAPAPDAPPRTRDQARADLLAGMAWAALGAGELAGTPLECAQGRPVTVNVTVPLVTALGLGERPGELEGYGPIDAETARRLACAGVWRWVRTDGTGGHALDFGRTRYTPPQDLVDFILLRDQECQAPGCHRSARRCQIDHRVRYPFGATSAENCVALCAACHRQKHGGGWALERSGPRELRWTSATGRSHRVTTPPLPT